MQTSRTARIGLRIATAATLAFIYVPIGVVLLYAFNAAPLARWPIEGLTIDWFVQAFGDAGIRSALTASLQAAVGAPSQCTASHSSGAMRSRSS
jgi:putative spermidine/putrescine transport system permease protein